MLQKSIKTNKNIKRNKRNLDAGKMLLLYMLLFLPVFVAAQGSQSIKTLDREVLRNDSRKSLDWIGENFLNTVDTFFPISKSCNNVEGITTIIIICSFKYSSRQFYLFLNLHVIFDKKSSDFILFYSLIIIKQYRE